MSQVIALDYGTKYIGVAKTDETGTLAVRSNTLIVGKKTALQLVEELIATDKPELLLIGLPEGLDGKPTQISKQVEVFAEQVMQNTGITYRLWNETNTSKQAESKFKDAQDIASHSEAARIMLQEYLNFIHTGV